MVRKFAYFCYHVNCLSVLFERVLLHFCHWWFDCRKCHGVTLLFARLLYYRHCKIAYEKSGGSKAGKPWTL